MAKVLKILGVLFLVLVVVVGVMFAIMIPKINRLTESAQSYVETVVPEIVRGWNPEALVQRSTEQMLASTSRERLIELFQVFSRLGELISLGSTQCRVNTGWYQKTGSITVSDCQVPARFNQGESVIAIQLLQVSETWKINGFRINSDVLLKSPDNK